MQDSSGILDGASKLLDQIGAGFAVSLVRGGRSRYKEDPDDLDPTCVSPSEDWGIAVSLAGPKADEIQLFVDNRRMTSHLSQLIEELRRVSVVYTRLADELGRRH